MFIITMHIIQNYNMLIYLFTSKANVCLDLFATLSIHLIANSPLLGLTHHARISNSTRPTHAHLVPWPTKLAMIYAPHPQTPFSSFSVAFHVIIIKRQPHCTLFSPQTGAVTFEALIVIYSHLWIRQYICHFSVFFQKLIFKFFLLFPY